MNKGGQKDPAWTHQAKARRWQTPWGIQETGHDFKFREQREQGRRGKGLGEPSGWGRWERVESLGAQWVGQIGEGRVFGSPVGGADQGLCVLKRHFGSPCRRGCRYVRRHHGRHRGRKRKRFGGVGGPAREVNWLAEQCPQPRPWDAQMACFTAENSRDSSPAPELRVILDPGALKWGSR